MALPAYTFADPRQRKFVIRFMLAAFSLFLSMYLNAQNTLARPVNTATAYSVKMLADTLGYRSNIEQTVYVRERGTDQVYVPTTLLTIGDFKAKVILECSAAHAGVLLVAFLIAYPATASQRLHGIVFLLPALVFANAVRIFVLMLLGDYLGPNSTIFHLFHLYVMRFIMIGLVLILALIWLRKLQFTSTDSPAWFFLRFLLITSVFVSIWLLLIETFGFHKGFFVNSSLSIITFISLVLSSSSLHVRKNRLEIWLCIGILVLSLLLLQGLRTKCIPFHSANMELLFVMVNSGFRYILPFGLFLLLLRKKIFLPVDNRGKRVFACPLCDKNDIKNLEAHAKAKHERELRQKDSKMTTALHDYLKAVISQKQKA